MGLLRVTWILLCYITKSAIIHLQFWGKTHHTQHYMLVADILLHCNPLERTGCCIHLVAHIEDIRRSLVRPDRPGRSFGSGIPIDHNLHIVGSFDLVGTIVLRVGMSSRLDGNWLLLRLAVVVEGYCSGSSAVFDGTDPPGPQGHPPMS